MLYEFFKRLLDILLSIIGCLFTLLLAPIIKIANMMCGDFGPVFLLNKRFGKNGKEFNLIKFRSMVVGAEEQLDELLKNDERLAKEYAVNKKLENDPRITKVGEIIRRFSIDEFPQFINILMGEMSVVGNRPYLIREQHDMGENFSKLVSAKPGLTGYWQVSGRNGLSFEERMRLETSYIDERCFLVDVKIFFKTFITVFINKGK